MSTLTSSSSTAALDTDEFVDNINDAFELRSDPMSLDTEFQSLEAWDSLASVSTIAMVYAHYDVEVSGDELLACERVSDILALVQQRQASAA